MDAPEEALALGVAEVFNTYQRSQFEATAGIAVWVVPTMALRQIKVGFTSIP
ncbi:MAG: hypothetical protein AB7I59_27180 [Geminicoccaceae bacterium]|uniref:hypothetical protein n=1 Tax=Reyranella sp. TaxID=1929291 RepID=UPI003D0DB946